MNQVAGSLNIHLTKTKDHAHNGYRKEKSKGTKEIKSMIGTEEKIQKITSRTVARVLGALEIENSSQELKASVKVAIWDSCNDIMKVIGEKENATRSNRE